MLRPSIFDRLLRAPAGLIPILLWISAGVQAAERPDEYQVKAAYILNFAKFVTWPASVFASPSDALTVCVLGQDPFRGALAQVLREKSAGGRGLELRTLSDTDAGGNCRILFVSESGRPRFRRLFEALKASGVLTIGDSPGFTAEGGVINLKLQDDRIRFEINLEAAEQAKLQISSKLLSLAEIVRK
jgi:hypothetical protein